MKYISIACIAALFVTACSSPQKKAADNIDTLKTKGPSNVINAYLLHFRNKQGKDSTNVDLLVQGDKISGLMDWFPYQQDGHSGVIEGTLKNDTIHATWGFARGLEKDTIAVELLLKDKNLSQKPLKLNTKNGRLETDETAGYTIKYAITTKPHR